MGYSTSLGVPVDGGIRTYRKDGSPLEFGHTEKRAKIVTSPCGGPEQDPEQKLVFFNLFGTILVVYKREMMCMYVCICMYV